MRKFFFSTILFQLLTPTHGQMVVRKADSNVIIINQKEKLPQVYNSKINFHLPYVFERDAIKVIVLMHGITGEKLETDPPTTGYYDSQVNTNTLRHVKAYFGYNFILRMMGYNGSYIANPDLEKNSQGFPHIESLSGINIRNPKDFFTKANQNENIGDHIYRLTTAKDPESFYVMLIPRDGTERMMSQADDAINKISNYYEQLKQITKKVPQLYFVCHSGGGIVSRMIMTPNIHFKGDSLNEPKAGFIRDRTICVTTISTPHEGSPLPDKIISIKNDAKSADAAKNHVLKSIPMFNSVLNFVFPGLTRNISFLDFVAGIPNFEDRDSRDNMSRAFMLDFNNGMGDPKNHVRKDGSMIPFYCMGGRFPTANYYSSMSVDEFGDVPQFYLRRGSNIEVLDKLKLTYIYGIIAAHYVLHAVDAPGDDPMNWGSTPAGQTDKLDIVRWGGKSPTGSFISYQYSNTATTVVPLIYSLSGSDGEVDTDGFVDYASAVGFNMGKVEQEYFDHAKGGSFYRFYSGPFEKNNHGTISQDPAVAQFITDNIIKIAGPYPHLSGNTSSWNK